MPDGQSFSQWLQATYPEQYEWLIRNTRDPQYKKVLDYWKTNIEGKAPPESIPDVWQREWGKREPPIWSFKSLNDLLVYLRKSPSSKPEDIVSVLENLVRSGGITPSLAVQAEKFFPFPEEPEREIARQPTYPTPEIEPYGPAGREYSSLIEGLPTPGMQSYYRQKYPFIFGQFGGEQAMQEAEVGRAEAIARAMRGVSGAKERRDVLARRITGERPTLGGTVPQAQLAKARGQVRTRAGALRRLRERTAKHPFEAYLEKYPFVKEFMKLPMRERGEYPSTYRPQTRWLDW